MGLHFNRMLQQDLFPGPGTELGAKRQRSNNANANDVNATAIIVMDTHTHTHIFQTKDNVES